MSSGDARAAPRYGYKELSGETLPDFERFFAAHPAPGAFPCWCMANHRAHPGCEYRDVADRDAGNRSARRDLVSRGRAHGILVYAAGEPVGWCQYGSWPELPRMDSNPRYRKIAAPEAGADRLWRITCFTVGRKHRGRGVASLALRAALEAIANKGGGIVEAYPVLRWQAYAKYRGTVSMFRKEGFETVAQFGRDNVVMRKTVRPAPAATGCPP